MVEQIDFHLYKKIFHPKLGPFTLITDVKPAILWNCLMFRCQIVQWALFLPALFRVVDFSSVGALSIYGDNDHKTHTRGDGGFVF